MKAKVMQLSKMRVQEERKTEDQIWRMRFVQRVRPFARCQPLRISTISLKDVGDRRHCKASSRVRPTRLCLRNMRITSGCNRRKLLRRRTTKAA